MGNELTDTSDQADHREDPFQVPQEQVDPTPFESSSDYDMLRTRKSSHRGRIVKVINE